MSEKNASYRAGLRDAKALSMEEKIDQMYDAFFLGKDCYNTRVSTLEIWQKVWGLVCSLFLAPLVVILAAKVFFGI